MPSEFGPYERFFHLVLFDFLFMGFAAAKFVVHSPGVAKPRRAPDAELVGEVVRTVPVRWSWVAGNVLLTKAVFALLLAVGAIFLTAGVAEFLREGRAFLIMFGVWAFVGAWFYARAPGWLILGDRGFTWRGDAFAYSDVRSVALWPDGSRRIRVYRKNAAAPSGEVISLAAASLTAEEGASIDAAFAEHRGEIAPG